MPDLYIEGVAGRRRRTDSYPKHVRYWRLNALRLVPNSFSDLLIPVLFRDHHGVRRVHAGGRVDLLSVLRFIPIGVFDDATVRTIGRAFDAACKELKDTGQPDVVHEVMIKRIIAAARKGERNVTRLRDAALTGLRKPSNEIRG
jgi:hypothetical protein